MQSTKISALTLVHNLIAAKLVRQNDPSFNSIWQIVYDITFKSTSTTLEDPLFQKQQIEIREEAINVVRECMTTFKGIVLMMLKHF